MARGQLLYRDVWEQRPPGIYWMYLWAFQILGWTAATVVWLDLLATSITTLLVFRIARQLADRFSGALAAALYAALTMPAWLYGYGGFLERAVSETFIVVCVCMMAWLAVRWQHQPSHATAMAFGLVAGATLIFKPNAGLYFPALLLWTALYSGERIAAAPRVAITAALTACAMALVVPAATLAWLWRLDLLQDAKIAVIDFNRYYVGEGFDIRAYALMFAHAVGLRVKTEPLWLIGLAGGATALWEIARNRRLSPLAGLTVIWGAAAVLVIVVNGARLFNSYFIQALPPLALLGAWFFAGPPQPARLQRILRVAVAALSVVMLVQRGYIGRVYGAATADIAVLSGRIERTAYLERFGGYNNRRGYSARANSELADYVRSRTMPDDRIFLFSINGAGVYFDANRLSAHRFLRVNFFVDTDFPHPEFKLESVVEDLRRTRPLYVIFERLHSTSDPRVAAAADVLPAHPQVATLLADYRLETRIEDFTVYRRVK